MSNYDLLIQKLDQFIRRYYQNKLIRGSMYFGAVILTAFLLINFLEYELWMSGGLRKLFFFGFIAAFLGLAWVWVVRPLTHIYKLGKVISHEQAANIIGTHFTNVQDKLLNILQLRKQSGNSDLINASIDQKIEDLKPVPFASAINFGENRKYLKYLVPPVLVFLFVLFAAPNVIKEGSERLLYNDQFFEKEMPFSFVVQNSDLKALQYEDYDLALKMEGDALPEDVYINYNGYSYKMKQQDANDFNYLFANLQKDQEFYFTANGFRSKDYTLDVLAKPLIVGFQTSLDYPNYTGKKDEVKNNLGDIVVPAGTRVTWNFDAENTEEIKLQFGDSSFVADRKSKDAYGYSQPFYNSQRYTVSVSNADIKDSEPITYSVTVIPDQYPAISVKEYEDSIRPEFLYYMGEVSDDYGLTKLNFNYQITYADSNNKMGPLQRQAVGLAPGQKISSFTHYWNTKQFGLKPGDKISYYFEVWDNDGIRGAKSTRSQMMTYQMPTVDEMEDETEANNEDIKKEMDKAMKEAMELQDEMKEKRDELLEKKNVSWEDKQEISEMMERQQQLQKDLEELNKKMDENFKKQDEFKEQNEQIKEKQKKLQELMDELMSPEMKELMKQLEDMLDDMSKEEMLEQMEDMDMSNEDLEKELDRMLELFKQLEFQQKLEETADKLEKLSEEQEELSEETGDENSDMDEMKEKQEEINEKMEDIKEDVEKLKELNEDMQNQQDFSEMEEQMEQLEQQMQNTDQQMQQGKQQKSSESQQKQSEQMQEMAQSMMDMSMQMQSQQMGEDLETLRQLLENLVSLSFDQEQLIDDIKATNINNPKYVQLTQEQYKLMDDFKVVEDTLLALAKRNFQIESYVLEKVGDVNKAMEKTVKDLEARQVGSAVTQQQYAMTGLNDLALMLSETMDQMQQQMAQMMPGQQQCQKPGSGMGMKGLKQMQQQLNDQIKEAGEMMKKGENPGKGGWSKKFAEMAAQQQALREALEEINQQQNSDGTNKFGDLEEIMDMMEKTETDLVNKQLSNDLMERQNDITVKLLEAEEAERNQDMKEERESNTGEDMVHEMPPSLEEYLKQRDSEVDLYKTVPPQLKPYYRTLVEKYFNTLSF